MAISIEQVEAEVMDTSTTPSLPTADQSAGSRVPNMDRIRLELRRDVSRLERLWAD
ncbi:MAG: hypothetical protein AB7F35_05080 [Acetobacteraceae bacterium]